MKDEQIKQILENQFHIMRYLYATETCKIPMFEEGLYEQIGETMKYCKSKKKNKTLKDRTEGALSS